MTPGAVSPLEAKRSRGELGDAGEQKDKRVRVTESENQGNNAKSSESQSRERVESSTENEGEFLEPNEAAVPPAPTAT